MAHILPLQINACARWGREQYATQTVKEHGMADKDQGINIANSSSNKFTDTYQKSDVEELYRKAHPTSWKDLLNYVESRGDATWHITPGEDEAMKRDLQRLAGSNTPFPSNPDQAYQEMSKYGTQGSVNPPQSGGQPHAH